MNFHISISEPVVFHLYVHTFPHLLFSQADLEANPRYRLISFRDISVHVCKRKVCNQNTIVTAKLK